MIYAVKRADIYQKQPDHDKRVKHRVAVHEIIKNIVRGAVAAHQKHIIVIDQVIDAKGGRTKANKN